MKRKILAIAAIASALATGSIIAQDQSGPGKGYGGPPQSAAERAARQAVNPDAKNSLCPLGGPGLGLRKGKGWAKGQGGRYGLRDGTGPRGVNSNCPFGNPRGANGACPFGNNPQQRGRQQ